MIQGCGSEGGATNIKLSVYERLVEIKHQTSRVCRLCPTKQSQRQQPLGHEARTIELAHTRERGRECECGDKNG